MKSGILATLGAAAIVSLATSALPCTCLCAQAAQLTDEKRLEDIAAKLETATIVFLGRVTGVRRDPLSMPDLQGEDAKYAGKEATLQVIREWKGERKDSYALTTSCCDAGCGYPFEPGQVHLFFLSHDRQQILYCCPDPSAKEVRDSVRALDRIAGKKPLRLPKELR
jgi:hypothetical protein